LPKKFHVGTRLGFSKIYSSRARLATLIFTIQILVIKTLHAKHFYRCLYSLQEGIQGGRRY